MKCVVLGAGVAGIASAWFLRESGHDVTVVDRQPGPGLETSCSGAGQLSVSHAQPWANPQAPRKVLKWLGQEEAPLLFRMRADVRQWLWGLRFLRECTAARMRHNIRQIVALGLYSRSVLQGLRDTLQLTHGRRNGGMLHVYTDFADLQSAREPMRLMSALGCVLEMKTPQQCVQIEPALAEARWRIVGGFLSPEDEQGDAHAFTQELALRCRDAGVKFLFKSRILGVNRSGKNIESVIVDNAGGLPTEVRADCFVLCLGAFSAGFARPLGVSLAVYPVKGYAVTMSLRDPAAAFKVSMSDPANQLVFSRLGERLRIAGTAEFNGFNSSINLVRCEAIRRRAMDLFPTLTENCSVRYWAGLRPSTPSNVPYIGRSSVPNLYLNTGHGTLGWTHSAGSGRAIAEICDGRKPELDFAFC